MDYVGRLNSILDDNYNSICRICLSSNNLYDIYYSKCKDIPLDKLLEDYIIREEVSDTDNSSLPRNICIVCIKQLLQVYKLHLQYKESTMVLKFIRQKVETNTMFIGDVQNYSEKYLQSSKLSLLELELECTLRSREGKLVSYVLVNLPDGDKTENITEIDDDKQDIIKIEIVEPENLQSEVTETKIVETEVVEELVDVQTEMESIKTCVDKDHSYSYGNDKTDYDSDDNQPIALLLATKARRKNLDPSVKPKPKEGVRKKIIRKDRERRKEEKRKREGVKKLKVKTATTTTDNILKEKKTWQCTDCSLDFTIFREFREHRELLHTDTTQQTTPTKRGKCLCPVCGKLTTRDKLSLHMRLHVTPKPFQCKLCSFRCSQSSNLRRHNLQHTGEKPFMCSVCGYVTTQMATLTRIHMKLHKQLENPINCDYCTLQFNTKYEYRLHRNAHSNERGLKHKPIINREDLNSTTVSPFECHLCKKVMKSKSGFILHVRSHRTDAIRFSCHLCSKTFQMKSGLTMHLRIHTGEKPYQCTLCPKQFNQQAHYTTHMALHANKREHKCEYCGQGFNLRFNLVEHVRIHTGETIDCEYCGKQFRHNSNRRKHIREQHGKVGRSRKGEELEKGGMEETLVEMEESYGGMEEISAEMER